MPIYQSMQRVRFSSPDGYEKFKVVFGDVRTHLKKMPGFLHLTWWIHPNDSSWHNEISFWTDRQSVRDWHMNDYHRHAKAWAVRSGAIMEDIITNFELTTTRLLRICPTCGHGHDSEFDLAREQEVLNTPCPQCGFHFPVMAEMADSSLVFRDSSMLPRGIHIEGGLIPAAPAGHEPEPAPAGAHMS